MCYDRYVWCVVCGVWRVACGVHQCVACGVHHHAVCDVGYSTWILPLPRAGSPCPGGDRPAETTTPYRWSTLHHPYQCFAATFRTMVYRVSMQLWKAMLQRKVQEIDGEKQQH